MAGVAFVLTGDKKLDAKLALMGRSVVRKVASKAVNRALAAMKKGIQSEIPPRFKSAKKAIGKRFNKAKTGEQRGMVVAKVGAGVAGKAGAKTKDRKGKPGVGISANNIHWLILGTKKRSTKANKSTGAMPAVLAKIVQNGISKTMGSAMSQMRDEVKKNIAVMAK